MLNLEIFEISFNFRDINRYWLTGWVIIIMFSACPFCYQTCEHEWRCVWKRLNQCWQPNCWHTWSTEQTIDSAVKRSKVNEEWTRPKIDLEVWLRWWRHHGHSRPLFGRIAFLGTTYIVRIFRKKISPYRTIAIAKEIVSKKCYNCTSAKIIFFNTTWKLYLN